jgi:hypothetical protein
MAERAADPVKLPDDQSVAGAELIKRPDQTRPVSDGAAASVLIQALAAGALQGIALKGKVLVGRGHAHVADQHRPSPFGPETEQSMVYSAEIDAPVNARKTALNAAAG